MKKGYQYTVVFMLLVAAIFTAILATTQAAMNPRIDDNREIARQQNLLYAFNIPFGETNEEIQEIYAANIEDDIRTIDGQEIHAFRQLDASGNVTGYAFPFSGPALWGSISGYLAVSEDLSMIKGLTFTEQNETPGLGGRIDEPPFKEQFRDVPMPEGNITYADELDAISGATQSSNAVLQVLNNLKSNVISKWEVD